MSPAPSQQTTSPPGHRRHTHAQSRLSRLVKGIAGPLVIWLLLRAFVIQAFHVTSGSMEKTVLVGDVLFVNKALYGAEVPLLKTRLPAFRQPRHDEIVVVRSPIEDLTLLKRIVALPGDTISMASGRLIRNGDTLPEPYVTLAPAAPPADPTVSARMRNWQLNYRLATDTAVYQPTTRDWGPLLVPQDSLMVLGDNRDESFDSRFYGFVPLHNLQGTPLVIYYSYDPSSWRLFPVLTAPRWSRLFTVPR